MNWITSAFVPRCELVSAVSGFASLLCYCLILFAQYMLYMFVLCPRKLMVAYAKLEAIEIDEFDIKLV